MKPNRFVRHTAIALCRGDTIKADDLIQEAWIAAWERGDVLVDPQRWMTRHVSLANRDRKRAEEVAKRDTALYGPMVAGPDHGTFLVEGRGSTFTDNGREILRGDAYQEKIRQQNREAARRRRALRKEAA